MSQPREDPDELDCQTCGACCRSGGGERDGHVGLTSLDLQRLSPAYRRLVIDGVLLPVKRTKPGHLVCIALTGSVGEQCSCSIYARRPGACRELTAGSDDCRAARREAGLEPPPQRPVAS